MRLGVRQMQTAELHTCRLQICTTEFTANSVLVLLFPWGLTTLRANSPPVWECVVYEILRAKTSPLILGKNLTTLCKLIGYVCRFNGTINGVDLMAFHIIWPKDSKGNDEIDGGMVTI